MIWISVLIFHCDQMTFWTNLGSYVSDLYSKIFELKFLMITSCIRCSFSDCVNQSTYLQIWGNFYLMNETHKQVTLTCAVLEAALFCSEDGLQTRIFGNFQIWKATWQCTVSHFPVSEMKEQLLRTVCGQEYFSVFSISVLIFLLEEASAVPSMNILFWGLCQNIRSNAALE